MNENNESVLQSFKQFLQTYDSGKTGLNVKSSPFSDVSTVDVANLSSNEIQTVVLRSRTSTDSCLFSDHTISPNDVEPEVFDWIFYHLDYKKCPHPLAFALASIVARKLGLAETTRESHNSDDDKSKPAISSNELYSQSLEYLTEYINSWKENPEIAVEIAKEYSSKTFVSSICAIKNTRRKMEDRHVLLPDLNKALALKSPKQYGYYAIFDGHAGVDAASYASAHLHYHLVKSQAFLDGDITAAFKEAFSITDLHYLERSAREGKKSGSTALCALLEDRSKVYIAWLGDSMAILVRNGKPIDIMVPHKPEHEEERKRIEDLGGFVAFVDTWRVSGTLAVSRAIGDPEHKPYISSEPDVIELAIDSDTDFLVMACDGLWDQMTPEEATSLVYEYVCENENQNIEEISRGVASHLSKIAKDDGSSDNITTIVIFFKDVEQLRATPYTPLTPREKNETNGLNGNHFQYNDFEFTQMNAKNPFDSSSDAPLSWSTGSAFDELNVAKLNFEINDSINSSENSTNESKGISNPFNSDDYSYADLNNANKTFDYFSNESSLLKEPTNSFDDKLESNTSQMIANECSNDMQSFQSESQFNISKLSDISSSFPTQAVIHCEHTLSSTPILQPSQPIFLNTDSQQNIILETNMDDTSDTNQESHPSQPLSFVDQSSGSLNVTDFGESYGSAESDIEAFNSFDKSGYMTAYENQIQKDMNDSKESHTPIASQTPISTPVKLDDVSEDIDVLNSNQDNNDLSSGAESVDSFCYEKIGSDLSKISQKVANDFQLQQMYGSVPTESEQQIQSEVLGEDNKFDSETVLESKDSDIITEALIAEHMSREEAQEFAQQLTAEQTEEVLNNTNNNEIKVETIGENNVSKEHNLFQSEAEQKINESIFSLSQTNSEDLIPESTTPINEIETEIQFKESLNVLKESNPESIEDLWSGSQLIPEVTKIIDSSEELIGKHNFKEEEEVSEQLVLQDLIPSQKDLAELTQEVQPIADQLAEVVENSEAILYPVLSQLASEPQTEESITNKKELIESKFIVNTSLESENPVVNQFAEEMIAVPSDSKQIDEAFPISKTEEITLKTEVKPKQNNNVFSNGFSNFDETSALTPELILTPTPVRLRFTPTSEPSLAPTPESTVEPNREPPAIPELFNNEMKANTEETVVSENQSTIESIGGQTMDSQMKKPKPQITSNEVSVIAGKVDPKKQVKDVVKNTKTLANKVSPLKTSNPIVKSNPKPKTTPTSSTSVKSPPKPLTKTTITSRLTSKPTASVATSKPTAPVAASKPTAMLAAKTSTISSKTATAPKPSATTVRRTATSTATTTSRVATTSSTAPKTSALTKAPPSTRPIGSRTTSTATNAEKKPLPSTRAPITSRLTSTAITGSIRSATTNTSRLTTARTNGHPSSGPSAKPAVTSSITRKTTASKPIQSTINEAKAKSAPIKPSTVGLKGVTSRLTTTRTTSSAQTRPMTTTNKNTKTTQSSSPSKSEVKPISIKGKTDTKAVPKSMETAIETNGDGSGACNSSATPIVTSLSNKTNPLKVTNGSDSWNSLKQELEDAMASDPIL